MAELPQGGPTSRIFLSQRLRMHYVDWGNAGKPPLLLLHGGRDHCRNWDWVVAGLREDWHIIAPDLRGHGDSQWSPDGNYTMPAYLYDLAQLIHQLQLAPLTIVAHSMGGNIALRYAGIYPEHVRRLVVIEGLGPSPRMLAERAEKSLAERMQDWMDERRALAGRQPRRYPSVEAALARMQESNPRLTHAQALHLTQHGVHQNEDGTYSWKFDNYVRSVPPYDMPQDEIHELWGRITCPTMLMWGAESWASNPNKDGRVKHFRDATVVEFEGAGHWVHHDKLDEFLGHVRAFL